MEPDKHNRYHDEEAREIAYDEIEEFVTKQPSTMAQISEELGYTMHELRGLLRYMTRNHRIMAVDKIVKSNVTSLVYGKAVHSVKVEIRRDWLVEAFFGPARAPATV
jgi:hypothetical protein